MFNIFIFKAKKVEMKTLDGVITRLNAAGEKQSINSKCADLDREVILSICLFISVCDCFYFVF
jgi:hypothetical protein